MSKRSRLGSLVIAAVVVFALQPPAWSQPSVLFSESFDDGLDRSWSFVRNHRKTRKLEGGKLHVRTRPGSLYQQGNNASNVMLRALPRTTSPLLIEVELVFRPQGLHENAGILYYLDDDNYALVDMGAHQEGDQPVRLQVLRESDGIHSVAHDAPATADRVFLGMRITADEITGLYRYGSADNWELLGSVARPEGAGARVGVEASNGSLETEVWAQFDNFRIIQLE